MRLSAGGAERRLHGDDRMLLEVRSGLFGVFDGVGSIPKSDLAADLAVRTVKGECEPRPPGLEALARALEGADRAIRERRLGCTTATVAWVDGDRAHWISVGDSRLYLIRGGTARQVSRDQGEGNRVDNVLGAPPSIAGGLTGQRGELAILSGDRLLLVTDGITGDYPPDLLAPSELAEAVAGLDPQTAAERLTAVARKRDDRSAIVVDIDGEAG